MRIASSATDVVCVQTAAGFEKVLGRKNFTSEEMAEIFGDHRADFEALANMIYEAEAGDTIIITPESDKHAIEAAAEDLGA